MTSKPDWFFDHCPPHRFETAWISDEQGGILFCRHCGELMPLGVDRIEAPAEERITPRADQKD